MISIAVALALLAAAAASAAAAPIAVYRNDMQSDSRRGEIKKIYGESCGRGGSTSAFRMNIGKRTRECAFATPVVGRDLEIDAIGRLLSSTPKKLQRKAFIAVNLRTGNAGAGYSLVVYPLQQKAQLRRKLSNGKTKYLRIAKNLSAVKGLDHATELKLRAFNITSGPDKGACRIRAMVGHRLIANITDDAAGELQGRASGFSIGANASAKGAVGSFDDVVVRVPNPF